MSHSMWVRPVIRVIASLWSYPVIDCMGDGTILQYGVTNRSRIHGNIQRIGAFGLGQFVTAERT
ncbi:hypothetical protein HAX54_033653, partial [Datura stramonium]|nr:hypothetical protein [Datura stramonium]